MALGKRDPEEDNEVEIIGFKYNPVKAMSKGKHKKRIMNDVSNWTANCALIDIDKENSPRDSQADMEKDCRPEVKKSSQVYSSFPASDERRKASRSSKHRELKVSRQYHS